MLNVADVVPLGNEPVLFDGKLCGKTASTAFGYQVGKAVALALLREDLFTLVDGSVVSIDIAGDLHSGRLGLT